MISLLKVPRYQVASSLLFSIYSKSRVEHNYIMPLHLENNQLFFLLFRTRYHLKPLRGQIIFCSIHCWWMEDKKLLTEEKRERLLQFKEKLEFRSHSLSFFSPKLLPFKSNVNFICTTQIVSTERKKILNQIRSLHLILFAMEWFLHF